MTRTYALLGVVTAAVVGLAACSQDSPTAPKASPTPQAYSVSLTLAPSEAEVNTAVVASATVKSGGQAVKDGTTVIFSITGCVPTGATTPQFDNGTCEMNRTTSGGVATATVVSAVEGAFEIAARVKDVTSAQDKRVVKFYQPTNPRTLAIYSVTPNRGRPEGGEQVVIRGRGFATPVTVDFVVGGATRHAQVLSVNADGTQLTVVTPATGVDANTEQTASITVTAAAGTASQVSDTLEAGFVFESQYSEPRIYAVEPGTGSYKGGEQVIIYGSNFFAPIKVTFGDEDAQFVSVSADNARITVLTPRHSGATITQDQSVAVTVYTNFGTAQQQTASRANAFTYLADFGIPLLYSVTPNFGSPRGGESLTLVGANLQGATVTFQLGAPLSVERPATVDSISPDGTTLVLTTPEASPNPVTSDVAVAFRITSPAGSATFTNVFTYVGEARPPILYYLDPDRGSARGGDTVTIYGRFLLDPLKVVFTAGGSSYDAQVIDWDKTEFSWVQVVTPAVQLTPLGQDTPASVTVTTQAGTGRDAPVTLANAFLYIAEEPTPQLYSLSPNSGPIDGGTRVTIFGTGFQYPVQVLFGDHQAEVVSSNFSEIICIAPSIAPTEPETPTTVQVTVTNMLTGKKSNTLDYRYGEAMFISSISPNEGPDTGGTQVTIFGQGFAAPISVEMAGVVAQVLSVSGTEVVVRTGTPSERSCSAQTGPVTVTNISSNLTATGPAFTYRPAHPLLTQAKVSVNGGAPAGNSILQYDAFGISACKTNPPYSAYVVHVYGENFEKLPNSSQSAMTVTMTNPAVELDTTWISANEITFQLPDLAKVTLDQAACTSGGEIGVRDIATALGITVKNNNNSCSDTLDPALLLTPCDTTCQVGAVGIELTPATLELTVGTTAQMTICINAVQDTDTEVTVTQAGAAGVIDFTNTHQANTTVVIPAHAACVSFAVNGLNGGGPVHVTAALPTNLGGGSSTAEVTVNPLALTLSPAELALDNGSAGNLTIQLAAPAPVGGAGVTVTQAGPAGKIDFTYDSTTATSFHVTIPEGEATYVFQVNALQTGGPVTVTAALDPALGGATASSSVTVGQYTVTLTPTQATIPAGGSSVFRVDLGAIAYNYNALGGIPVEITQTGPGGIVSVDCGGGPAATCTLLIPTGQQVGQFDVLGNTAGGPVTVTVSLPSGVGGSTASADITVVAYTISLQPTSLSLAPGSKGSFSVALDAPAAGDIHIFLSQTGPTNVIQLQDNGGTPIAASPNNYITIPDGQISQTFLVLGLTQGGPVTITAQLDPAKGSSSATASVTVSTLSITASPTSLSLPVGGTGTFTVSLNQPAPPGGIQVTLTSGNASIADFVTVSPITVAAGSSTSTPITVEGLGIGATTLYARLPDAYGGGTATVQATVAQAITIAPASLSIPVNGTGTFTISIATAQPSNVTVNLTYSGSPSGAVDGPATVVINANTKSSTFDVTGLYPTTGAYLITAQLPGTGLPDGLAGATTTANVTVTGTAGTPTLTVNPNPAAWSTGAAGDATMTLGIVPTQTTDTVITLGSSNPTVAEPSATTATITSGSATATFDVAAHANGATNITAALPPYLGGTVTTVPFTVFTPSMAPLSLPAGTTANMIFSVSNALPFAITIDLSSATPGAATVPATATLPALATSVSVPVTGVSDGSSVITATLPAEVGGGNVTATATVTELGLTLAPASATLYKGAELTMTVTMGHSRTVPTVIDLSDAGGTGDLSFGGVPAPTTVTIPALSTSTTFTLGSGDAGGAHTVTAQYAETDLQLAVAPTASITVQDLTLAFSPTGVTMAPSSTQTMTAVIPVTLPIPVVVTLGVSATGLGVFSVPASVTIPAGATTSPAFDIVSTSSTGAGDVQGTLPVALNSGAPPHATAHVEVTQLGITLSPPTVTAIMAGGGQVFTVSIPQSQPSDTVVMLSAIPTSMYVSVPASVTIPAGSTTAQFTAVGEQPTPGPMPTTIRATLPSALGGAYFEATITGVINLTVATAPTNANLVAATDQLVTVTLGTVAAKPIVLTLSTSQPLVVGLRDQLGPAPPAVGINSLSFDIGESSKTFAILGVGVGDADVSATAPPTLGGMAGHTAVHVNPIQLELQPVTANIAVGEYRYMTAVLTNVPGGVATTVSVTIASSYSTVTIDPDGFGGPLPALASLPINILAGTNSREFYVVGNAGIPNNPVAVTGTLAPQLGGGTAVANISVNPSYPDPGNMTISPDAGSASGGTHVFITTDTGSFLAGGGYKVTIDDSGTPAGCANVVAFADHLECDTTAHPAGSGLNVNVEWPLANNRDTVNTFTYTADLTLTVTSAHASYVTNPGPQLSCAGGNVGTCTYNFDTSTVDLTAHPLASDNTWTWNCSSPIVCADNSNPCTVPLDTDPTTCTIVFSHV